MAAEQVGADTEGAALLEDPNTATFATASRSVGGGTNRALVIVVSIIDFSESTTITGIVFNAASPQNFALVGRGNHSEIPFMRSEMWELANPANEAATCTISLTPGTEEIDITYSLTEWINADQTTPVTNFTTAEGESTSASLTVTTAAGEVVIDMVQNTPAAGAPTVGADQTQQMNLAAPNSGYFQASSIQDGGDGGVMEWAIGASARWSIIGASVKEAAAAGEEIEAEPGANTITGVDATLIPHYLTGADPGSYAITGADASLNAGYAMNAEPGDYAVTGVDAEFGESSAMEAEPGSYAATGQDASLVAQCELNAEPGSYAITGADATLENANNVSAEAGAYAATGQTAGLIGSYQMIAEPSETGEVTPGSYQITGADAALEGSLEIDAEAGAYAVTGADATLLAGYSLEAEPGSYVLAGADATLSAGFETNAEAGSYAVNGVDAEFVHTQPGVYSLECEPGAYATTGSEAAAILAALAVGDPGAYAVSGVAAVFGIGFPAGAGAYSKTGVDAELSEIAAEEIEVESGSYALTGVDVQFVHGGIRARPARRGNVSSAHQVRRRR